MRANRYAALVGITCLLSLPACASSGGGDGDGDRAAAASCAGPQLAATPASVHAGARLAIRGRYFAESCGDTVANGSRPADVPMTHLSVVLRQGHRSWTLDDDVNPDGELSVFSLAATVPADVPTGAATVSVPGTAAVTRVTISR